MKPPLVTIVHPKARRRVMQLRSELYSVNSILAALRVTPEVESLVPESHPWRKLLDKRDLLSKQIASLMHYHGKTVRVHATDCFLFVGEERIDMRAHPDLADVKSKPMLEFHQKNAWWVAAHALVSRLRGNDTSGCVQKAADRMVAYWRHLHPVKPHHRRVA